MRKVLLAGAALSIALSASPALAHVTVQPNEAIAGGFQTFFIQVPNERDDASTTKVEVQFPPVFASVSFQDVEGWERKVEMVEFDEPIEAFGEEITEGVGSVTFTGGEVQPGEFVRFPFSVGPLPGGELEFRAIQTYDSGEVVRWIGPADADEPAARVNAIDLGLEEGQGQLGALAELRDEPAVAADAETSEESGDGSTKVIAIAAGVLALIALIVALTRKPAA
jgi:uncharacterized protein YcnI